MTTVIGIDSSTQSCKVLARDLESGRTLALTRQPHPTGTEVDPQAWWDALQTAFSDLPAELRQPAAISVGGQQHGLVVLDSNGEVLRPALLWNDTRSAAAAQQLTAELSPEQWVARIGSVPVASFTNTKLRWIADHEPEIAERIAAICLPHDWLTWRLRGFGPGRPDLAELVTDRSDASGTGYFDLATSSWDRELLDLALRRDSENIVLPTVLEPTESRPSDQGVLVAAGAGDNAAAALGLALKPGDIVVSLGTSGTVFASTETAVHDPSGTVACFADARGGYLPIVTTMNAARVLDTTARLLGVGHAELSDLALQAAPGSGGLVLHPYFEGERTPNLPDETATLSGITGANFTRTQLARAAFEGMLCGLAEGVAAVGASGAPVERLLLIGGAAQSPAAVEVAATVFDVPLEVPGPDEYVAAGAAAQAAWAATGKLPEWPRDSKSAPAGHHDPSLLGRYQEFFRRRYPTQSP